MSIAFVCKASVNKGFGHLVRCQALIDAAPFPVELHVIDDDFYTDADVIVYDLNELDERVFERYKDRLKICLSYKFEHLERCDVVIHRSSYIPGDGKITYRGLEYAVIPPHCVKVTDEEYEKSLNLNLSMGVNMGGGNLWKVLKNCAFLVCSAGITPYEACYAGIPTIIIADGEQAQSVKELEERGVCVIEENINDLSWLTKDVLREMRENTKGLIDEHGVQRIWEIITNESIRTMESGNHIGRTGKVVCR